MAFAIPKIQYKNVDTTGNTTIFNGVITSIPGTSQIEVGMFVRGAGIPDGSFVGAKTPTTVTLASAVQATATASGVALSFGYEILFTYPPKEDSGEELESKNVTSESISGAQQTSINYIEGRRKLKFSFLSQSLYLSVNTFLTSSALRGHEFRYFEDQTLLTYVEYELDKLKVGSRKIAPKGVDVYVWEVPLDFRRVL